MMIKSMILTYPLMIPFNLSNFFTRFYLFESIHLNLNQYLLASWNHLKPLHSCTPCVAWYYNVKKRGPQMMNRKMGFDKASKEGNGHRHIA
jgi:hypothetical protein